MIANNNLQRLAVGNFNAKDSKEEPAVDTNQIKLDIEGFDVELFDQLALLLKDDLAIAIEEYLEDASAYIRDIEHGMRERDITKMARGSHPLKSNSKGFGLIAVSKIAEMINNACEVCDDEDIVLENIQDLILHLKEAFDFGEKQLKNELKIRS